MQFNDVIGQHAIKKRLIESVSQNRLSHALLFSGDQGVGKLAMALAFAQYINCPNRTETDSCGECPSCKKSKKLIHPDIHYVFPVVKSDSSKAPVSNEFIAQWRERVLQNPYFNINDWFSHIKVNNAQGMIYVNESKNIIDTLNLKTFEAEYKIMIIWMAERMNIECANKLLKMIEEPPPKTLLILITEAQEQILPTILSRTQIIPFPSIDKQSMAKAIADLPQSQGQNIDGIVHQSKGNFIHALNLLVPDEMKTFCFEQFTSLMRLTYKRDWEKMFEWVEKIAAIGRENQKIFLQYCLRMIRENFVKNLNSPELVFLNDDEKAFSDNFSPFINERNILLFYTELENAYRDISYNGYSRVVLLDLVIKISKFIKA